MTGCGREPHLHVVADRAMWRWLYHEPAGEDGDGLELQSSIGFADAEEARSAATSAYPGIPVAADDERTEPAAGQEQGPKHPRCPRSVPAALAAAVLVAIAVIIVRQRSVDDHRGRPRPDARQRFRRAGPLRSGPRFRLGRYG